METTTTERKQAPSDMCVFPYCRKPATIVIVNDHGYGEPVCAEGVHPL